MAVEQLRYLRLTDNLVGFYDGRIPELRFADHANWVDEGALSLGICSYALIDGPDAIVYDTHVSVAHARYIRRALKVLGASNIKVVLSHWHLDHVAGTEAFSDCEIITSRLTGDLLRSHQPAIEAGTHDGPPAIKPLILPTTLFDERTELRCGRLRVNLIAMNIHSRDSTILYLADEGILLAGDTLEDTITYVSEPLGLNDHLNELDRMWGLGIDRIFPNHGDPAVIELGGYRKTLIRATQQYIRMLLRSTSSEDIRNKPLAELIAGPLQAGWINYFPAYEAVHRQNLSKLNNVLS